MPEQPNPRTLTEPELAIMKLVWRLGKATVRQVYEELREQKKVAYTTVMTMMKILTEKGFLAQRETEGRAYVYEPTAPESKILSGMVQEFLDRVFNGAAQPLVLSLLKDQRLSERELAEIRRLIAEDEDDDRAHD
jgi:predicted transcriptional regulator